YAVEHALVTGLRLALCRLVLLPGMALRLRRSYVRLSEHVRVTPHHLVAECGRDGVEIEMARLLGHAGVEHDLKEQVAKLLLERRHVDALDRVRNLVGLFDRIGRYRREGLL